MRPPFGRDTPSCPVSGHELFKPGSDSSDHEKILANIEKGEARIKKMGEIQTLLSTKIAKYKMPLHQLKVNYGGNKGKSFTDEEDRFMVMLFVPSLAS